MSIYVQESVKGDIIEWCLTGESVESILSMCPIANAAGDVLTAEEVWKIALANGDAAGALMDTEGES